jgi:hypothetical protein
MEPSFLKIETYQADDLTQAGTAISRLRDNDIGAILLKDVYPKDSLAKLPVILAENTPDFITTTFPAAFCAYFYGIKLNLAESDMTPYFAAEPVFRKKTGRA